MSEKRMNLVAAFFRHPWLTGVVGGVAVFWGLFMPFLTRPRPTHQELIPAARRDGYRPTCTETTPEYELGTVCHVWHHHLTPEQKAEMRRYLGMRPDGDLCGPDWPGVLK